MNSEHGFYNRYFKDYMEVPVENSNGKFRRIYVGDYYRQELNGLRYVMLRVVYLLCFVLSTGLFLLAALRDWLSNFLLIIAVPTAASVVSLLLLLVALLFYVFARRKMTIGEYNETSGLLKRYSLWAAVTLLLTGVCTVVAMTVYRVEAAGGEMINALLFALAAVPAYAMRLVEQRVPYSKTPSGVPRPHDGLEI